MNDEWCCVKEMCIEETRMLHDIVSDYLPLCKDIEQKAYLLSLKENLNAMILDHTYQCQ